MQALVLALLTFIFHYREVSLQMAAARSTYPSPLQYFLSYHISATHVLN